MKRVVVTALVLGFGLMPLEAARQRPQHAPVAKPKRSKPPAQKAPRKARKTAHSG